MAKKKKTPKIKILTDSEMSDFIKRKWRVANDYSVIDSILVQFDKNFFMLGVSHEDKPNKIYLRLSDVEKMLQGDS